MLNGSISQVLTDADVLIIVPPFAGIDRPSLGVHTLQACALEQGFTVSVFYANLLFAQRIGAQLFHDLSYGPTSQLMGERLFAQAAYGHGKPAIDDTFRAELLEAGKTPAEIDHLIAIAADAAAWVTEVTRAVLSERRYAIIGATTTFEQTAASVAFLNTAKLHDPALLTIIGGANCEGPMADGIASLSPHLDYIFSGESETTFLDFLNAWKTGKLPADKVYYGEPNRTMESLPCPTYIEFYRQLDAYVDPAGMANITLWLPYESSRGCWWGQKHHCTFCGLNGSGMVFRQKSAERIIKDLRALGEHHPNKRVTMADNIMPNNYFKTLLPRLGAELPGYDIFYEQKANLDLRKVITLRQGNVTSIQPGIEALSTPLLRLMDKGVSAAQNLALLRYGGMNNIEIKWNLLCGFPGDQRAWYEDTLQIIRRVSHLQPPAGMFRLSLDRFSPYYERAAEYGIHHVRPMKSYFDVLPASADVPAAAYHFVGTFESDTYQYPDLMTQIDEAIAEWRALWRRPVGPVLTLTRVKEDAFILKDTRELPNTKPFDFVNLEQARAALVGLPDAQRGASAWAWALERHVAMEIDGHLVPLALADNALLLDLEGTAAPAQTTPAASLIMPA